MQGELTKPQDLFDGTDYWLDSILPQTVDRLADLHRKLVCHFDLRTGIFGWWLRQLIEEAMPTLVVRFPPPGDVKINAASFECLDVGFAEIPIVQRSRFRFPHLGRDGIQSRFSFLVFIGMIGE